MKKRILCLLLSCLMVLSLCPMSFAEGTDECNFYLEFLYSDDIGHYVNWDSQVKWVNYSHCVNLYHKVGQDYVLIDADSLTSSDSSVVSVEYCATDEYNRGYTGYYYIRQRTVGTAVLSYTYTVDGQQYDASYEYTVEKGKQQFYITIEEPWFYTGFGWSGGGDKSQQGRENLRFYTSQDEESLITNKNALTFPEGAGTFTYKGDGYWDWDPTNATDGTYKIEYTAGGKTQFAYCFVNSDDEPYTGDRLYLTEGTPATNFFSGMGRSKGSSINGIRFYKVYNDQSSLIMGEDGFTFPDGGGTFTYQGDGVWNWDSSTGTVGDYEITYTDGEECYYINLYVHGNGSGGGSNFMEDIESVTIATQTVIEGFGGYWCDEAGNRLGHYEDGAWFQVEPYFWTNVIIYRKSGKFVCPWGLLGDYGITPRITNTKNWSAGNTYTMVANIGGIDCTFDVIYKANPVKSIKLASGSTIQNAEYCNGVWCSDSQSVEKYQENAWFYYSVSQTQFSVTFLDGTTKIMGQSEIYKEFGDTPTLVDSQSAAAPWEVGGIYPVTAYLGNVSCTFDVEIVESSIQSVTIHPLTVYQGDNTYIFNRYHGDYERVLCTVTFRNGEVCQMPLVDLEDIYGISITPRLDGNCDMITADDLTVGETYTEQYYIGKQLCTFEVTCAATPVVAAEALATETLLEHQGGLWYSGDGSSYSDSPEGLTNAWYRYYLLENRDTEFLITLRGNDTPQVMTLGELYDAYGIWPDTEYTQGAEHWEVGNTYTATVKFGDVTCSMPVEIIPTDESALDSNNRNCQGIYFRLNNTDYTATVGTGDVEENNSGYTGGQGVTIPDTVTKDNVTYKVIGINQYAFASCTNIKTVRIGKNVTSIIPTAFLNCKNLKSFIIDEENTYFKDKDGALYDWAGKVLYIYPAAKEDTEYTVPSTCVTISNKAFYGASNLTKITVPQSVTNIGENAFSGCDNLTEITLPFIGGCYELDEEREYNGTADYDHIDYVFDSEKYAETGGVPASLKTVTILNANLWPGAFQNCINIENIYLPNFSETGFFGICDMAFYRCRNLKKLVFDGDENTPYSGLVIPNYIKNIGGYAFYDCRLLPGLDLGDRVENIYVNAFAGCNRFQTVKLGKNVKFIGEGAFDGCSAVGEYIVDADNQYFAADSCGVLYSKDMTTLRYYPSNRQSGYYNVNANTKTIAESAFSWCRLTNLYIPQTVTTLEDNSIWQCPNTTFCVYQGSSAAKYVNKNNLTVWYMDNAVLQSVSVTSVPQTLVFSAQNVLLNAPEAVATYKNDDGQQIQLMAENCTLTYEKPYGEQTVTLNSSGKSTSFEATVLRKGDINGDSTIAFTKTDATDMQCLYEYLSENKVSKNLKDDLDYFDTVADVNGDSAVNILDYQALYEMVKS